MKKTVLFILLAAFLGACSTAKPPEETQNGVGVAKPQFEEEGPELTLDWVDFIQWDGNHYVSLDSAFLADPNSIGKKIGEIEFNVADNVHTANYRIRNGDAAFWETGTELLAIKSMPDFLAVKDPSEISGYRLYLDFNKKDAYPQHFKDFKLEEVTKIEIYDMFRYDNFSSPELLDTLEDGQEVEGFLKMLTGEHAPQEQVLVNNPPDPEIYAAVLYSDKKTAGKFHIYREGKQWLWYPWDREFLPAEMGSHMEKARLSK